jgi:glycerol 3-phosphatase-2
MNTLEKGSFTPLSKAYDGVLVDLDGVVYLMGEPIAHAVEALRQLQDDGVGVGFATNNASRTRPEIVDLLGGIGVTTTPMNIATSGHTAAHYLDKSLPRESLVLVVGAEALTQEVTAVGLRPATSADESPLAVVQGFASETGWEALAEASVAIRRGAQWVVTNRDTTLPSVRGPLPGAGALVAAVATALDRDPDIVIGKPSALLYDDLSRLHRWQHPLVVGDRLDTDIAAAVAGGYESLLVLTGVTRPLDLLAAPPSARPTYIGADLRACFTPHPPISVHDRGARRPPRCPPGSRRRRLATHRRQHPHTAGRDRHCS